MEQLEVLVINDGSKDNSSAFAHEYETKHPYTFRVIDKENGNYGSCVNRGLKEAAGKYIKVLDADDWFDTANFEKYLQFLAKTDVDLVLSDFDNVSEDGTVQKTHLYNIPDGEWRISELGDALYDMWMHAVTYKRAIFEGLNYHQTEGISYTDQEWIFLQMSRVQSLCGFPHVVYKYLVGRDGQTVDPKIFAHNISQEIRSWKTQQEEWETSAQSGRGDAEAYMGYRLKSRAVYVFTWMILHYKEGFDNQMLLDFDKYIKEHNPSLYDKMDSAIIRKGMKFRYIHYWRRFHCRPLIWLCSKTESVLKRKLFGI
jgi:glycosyltransferase involved in cell wall biosynthesis